VQASASPATTATRSSAAGATTIYDCQGRAAALTSGGAGQAS
jgi:hypothetical protein